MHVFLIKKIVNSSSSECKYIYSSDNSLENFIPFFYSQSHAASLKLKIFY